MEDYNQVIKTYKIIEPINAKFDDVVKKVAKPASIEERKNNNLIEEGGAVSRTPIHCRHLSSLFCITSKLNIDRS